MKKLKRIIFDNGTEGLIDGNIDIKISGRKITKEEMVEVEDKDVKKLLDNPKKYKLEGKKVKAKKI